MANSPSNTTIINPIYLQYRDAGPSLDLIVPAMALYVVAICGVIMNSFVVYITIKSRSLRASTTNVLMALICLLEVMHQSGHTLFLAVVVSGKNFVGILTASQFMAPMLFGANAVMLAMAGAAADRLFAISASKMHIRLTTQYKVAYLFGHFFAVFLFGSYSLYYIFSSVIQHPDVPTTGVISEILSAEVGDIFFLFTTLLNVVTLCCYLLIWLIIRCKNGVSKETNTRLLRSLVVIMLVSVGGYLINLSIYQLIFLYVSVHGQSIRVWQLAFVAGLLLNMGAASNAPILYLNSTEYRKAFKQELKRWANLFGRQNGQITVLGAKNPGGVGSTLFQHVGPPEKRKATQRNSDPTNSHSISLKRY